MPKRLTYSQRRARGTYARDPGRERGPEVEGRGELGDPPEGLDVDQRVAWLEIAANAPDDLLTESDRLGVEVASRLLARFRAGEASPSETSVLVGLLGRLGCTPADRQRIPRPAPKNSPVDPLELALGRAPAPVGTSTDEERQDRTATDMRRS